MRIPGVPRVGLCRVFTTRKSEEDEVLRSWALNLLVYVRWDLQLDAGGTLVAIFPQELAFSQIPYDGPLQGVQPLNGRSIFWGRYGTEHQCISTQFHRLRGTRKHLNNPRSVTPPAGTCTLVSLLELGAWTTADLASWVLKRCEKKGTQALETQLRVANWQGCRTSCQDRMRKCHHWGTYDANTNL